MAAKITGISSVGNKEYTTIPAMRSEDDVLLFTTFTEMFVVIAASIADSLNSTQIQLTV